MKTDELCVIRQVHRGFSLAFRVPGPKAGLCHNSFVLLGAQIGHKIPSPYCRNAGLGDVLRTSISEGDKDAQQFLLV